MHPDTNSLVFQCAKCPTDNARLKFVSKTAPKYQAEIGETKIGSFSTKYSQTYILKWKFYYFNLTVFSKF